MPYYLYIIFWEENKGFLSLEQDFPVEPAPKIQPPEVRRLRPAATEARPSQNYFPGSTGYDIF
jgi:hypothetical protein